ncbi:cation:proton antiporter [Candidatus Atelocyanobacterium thalassae]|uniref:Sodium/proton antiporter, CPA1 family n=2 Tax=Candidatus Atelocyanobacterium thalassae TaxID=713887 RepID=A0A086CIS1_9CHRO|nr:cation:proton antiporter [Candidatus Atelocyanobacterium thalassa]KFF42085.1 MAG: sodium/proton antiporter, CPA1 family [Candidatus Atelocyanobacterium thalassa isolate SIO64986]BDA39899.1 K(+)/H(+) antiporter NhaP2 [cyanobacterium endosymbiont of Braarudosphaera bigelowii]
MELSFELTLQIVIAVLAGISAQVIAELFRVPSIVFLLLFGMLLGADGFNFLHPHGLGVGLEVLVALSVAIILFEGGLNLELRDLGRVSGSLRNLVTFGTLITLVGGGMAAHWFAEFPWSIAFLYAALVVVTGPTVISPLLKQVEVERKVATLLESEGVLIDPVGAILAVVVFDTILNSNASPLEIVSGLLLRFAIGVIIGGVSGAALGFILKNTSFLSEDLRNLVVLAGVWGLFGLAQLIRSESGLMATVVAGIVLRASSIPDERLLRRFKGQLTVLCVSVLFILLAADLSIDSIFALGWGSVLTVFTLMWIVRPISVILCTINSDLSWRQKFFLGWIAPRGIVSASIASLFAILLTQQGINGGDSIKALVFLTIMMTVFIQGLSARWVAKGLKITAVEAKGAVIVGCNSLGRLMGKLFTQRGESVVLIDTDPEACDQAQSEGLSVFQSSALDPNVLEEAGIGSMGTFMALTSNGQVNLVLAQRAVEEFKPPRVFAIFPSNSNRDQTSNKTKIMRAFIDQQLIKIWNQYLIEGQFKLGITHFQESGLFPKQAHFLTLIKEGEVLPLLIKRKGSLQIVQASQDWQIGDEIIYLLRDPRPKLLKHLSGKVKVSKELIMEFLPEVEEFPSSTSGLINPLLANPSTEVIEN